MTTEKQIQANRKNASKSTGAKTKEGKSKVSQNAIKHGILSIKPILPWEPENEFEKFSLEFKNSLKPQGSIENFLIDRLITIGWRIKRIAILEAGIITVKCYENQKKYVESELHQMRFPERIDPELRNNKERFNKYIDVCILKDQIQSGMLEDIPTMGAIIQESMDTFITLQRYEKQLEKQFFMTLYQLEKIQNQRKAIPAVTVEN